MLSKVLVANRVEIAIRAFRAAYELGARTVAVFPNEDRWSEHRLKADEAYEIGQRGHPVRAYLDPDAIVAVAVRSGADAVYPGYGFLSENPKLAEACAAAGITFVGPTAEVLELTGNKARAIAAAKEAGVPTLRSVEPSDDVDTLVEEAVTEPRHIEVQILADAEGTVIHLFERDCSVQRRHQKVVEIAPAPNLDPELRDRMCAHAVAFARHIGYVNAGTVEFLLAPDGRYVFIEMNPRIQVEHTVTEEITDVDLVQAQLRIASGETLADLQLSQDTIRVNGAALQCRITTEDPANGFRPDTGTIPAYRSAGGAGVRLDGGTVDTGVEISAHFDSMLVKLTCRGRDFPTAVPGVPLEGPPPAGSRDQLVLLGPEQFAHKLREQTAVAVTDTTFRDAHQSLLATRVRTRDLVAAAGPVARLTPQLWSVEAWGGGPYDVALRVLSEGPWDRLTALRQAMPKGFLQMLLRARNPVGYTPYPTQVTDAFVEEA